MKASLKSFVIASLVLAPALAFAQPKTADDWYKEGETQYNLGNFDGAADAFKQGFAAEQDESKKPAYLYNVAQSYRQANKCKDAAFFYKRYLSLKEQDTVKPLKPEKKAEVEQHISEMEDCAKTQGGGMTTGPGTGTTTTTKTGPGTTTTKTGPGTGTTTKTGPGTGTTTTKTGPTTGGHVTAPTAGGTVVGTSGGTSGGKTVAAGGNEGNGEGEGEGEGEDNGEDNGQEGFNGPYGVTVPKMVTARMWLGGTKFLMGDLSTGFRGAVAITGGYPVWHQDKITVDAGLHFSYNPMDYSNWMTTEHGRASFVALMANGGGSYAGLMPKLTVRGDLGLGIMTIGGISDAGSPFTMNGAPTTGALTTFSMRIAASADYEVIPNVFVTATPFSFSYSPAPAGFRSDIGSIVRFDFMVGAGYRM